MDRELNSGRWWTVILLLNHALSQDGEKSLHLPDGKLRSWGLQHLVTIKVLCCDWVWPFINGIARGVKQTNTVTGIGLLLYANTSPFSTSLHWCRAMLTLYISRVVWYVCIVLMQPEFHHIASYSLLHTMAVGHPPVCRNTPNRCDRRQTAYSLQTALCWLDF